MHNLPVHNCILQIIQIYMLIAVCYSELDSFQLLIAWTSICLFCDQMSRLVRKPTICICEIKVADQLRSNCEADQRLCFRYKDSTIPLLSKSKFSGLQPSSVTAQAGLCSKTTLLVFPRGGSNSIKTDRIT